MRAVDIIIKKRDKKELSKEEINFFVQGFVRDQIPDYQVTAWAMAVVLNGMTPQETTDLTLAMVLSGRILDLSGVVDIAVDKHSSGGVGDKTSLVVLPMVAAAGLPVGKMSGRGLGFSGGTLDKMESIPGYRVDLNTDEFKKQLKGTRHRPHRAVGRPGTCGWQAICPSRRDWNGTIHSVDRLLHYEQKDSGRGSGDRAGRQGGARRLYGNARASA